MVAKNFHVDTSELDTLAADLRAAPEHLTRHIYPVLEKGANNIKRDLVAEMNASQHFKSIAHTISYDITTRSMFGTGSFEAEIGPSADPGSPGNLANIAYFGTSRGGGTVRDPQAALDDELPRFEKNLGDLLEDLI